MRFNYDEVPSKYHDDAFFYCQNVVEGKTKASKKVIKACLRHLYDLKRIEDDDFNYEYHVDKADNVIEFIETLPDVKTGKPNKLAYFQKFILSSIYGWRDKTDETIRRVKKAFISVARKNGKTILVAGIILYEFLFGKNPQYSRQIFCTANDKKQASIAFDMARKQLDALRAQNKEVRKATKRVRELLKNLIDESYVMPLSKDTGAVDGFEPYIGVLDEYAASKTNEMLELLVSGQGLLDNPLILIISTAGFNLNAPMFTIEYPRAEKVLNGDIIDDHLFIYIAEQDSEDEIEDESNWIKSNPILEIDAVADKLFVYLRNRLKEAKENGLLNGVLVKNFNMWKQADEDSYMDKVTWQEAELEEKPSIYGRRTWIGVDVGRTSDLFSISWLTMMDDYWFADSYSFVATKYGLQVREKRDGISYTDLARVGECEITQLDSGVIDDERVMEWLEEFVYSNNLQVEGIFYDPAQFGSLLAMIEKRHPEWLLGQITQSALILNMPTKQLRDDVKNLRVRHAGNKLLTMAVNNAHLKFEPNGIRIDKNKNSNKIDPLDALLDCYAAAYLEPFDGSGRWTNEKILESGSMF